MSPRWFLHSFTASAAFWAFAGFAPAAPPDDKPRVIRTFTHHQITGLPKGTSGPGVFPAVLSDNGNRIVFPAPGPDGKPRIMAVDFDGKNLSEIDAMDDPRGADISADGSRIVWFGPNEIRIAAGDGSGKRTLYRCDYGQTFSLRISGDARTEAFMNPRGDHIRSGAAGDQGKDVPPGVYVMSAAGGLNEVRRVAGPEDVARLRGTKPEDCGPNFRLSGLRATMDISHDGRQIAFGCWVKNVQILWGCDGNGANLHKVLEADPLPPSGYGVSLASLALSADGRTVAYCTANPDEVGVVGFDGRGQRVLIKGDKRFQGFFDEPLFIAADGSRVTRMGRHFLSDGSAAFQLMGSCGDGVMRYWEYQDARADARGRRFVYWINRGASGAQLAGMEINLPADQAPASPRIPEITLEPGFAPADGQTKPGFIRAKVAFGAGQTPGKITANGFLASFLDLTLHQAFLFDDGTHDDAKAGDGIYTSHEWYAYKEAPAGPWTLRLDAQSVGADDLWRGYAVEIGPIRIAPYKPGDPPVVIDGTAPPQTNIPPQTSDPLNPNDPNNPKNPNPPQPGRIDLTGLWVDDNGVRYSLRQMGDKVWWSMDNRPRVLNVFTGAVAGDMLAGDWVDLPGGELFNSGSLKLKIESNDRLVKIAESIAYGAKVLTRVKGGGGPGPGPGPGLRPGPGPVGKVDPAKPWESAAGQACFEKWIAEAMRRVNAHNGSPAFNARKPYGINRYGLLEGKGLTSAFAPDNFRNYGNNRYWYMWYQWVPSGPMGTWLYPEWNAAGVPPLREYVLKCLAEMER